jgi:stage II sporulation protein D
MNVNLWKKIPRRSACVLLIAALSLSLLMIPGGASVNSGRSPAQDSSDGSGFVYADDVSPTADHMIRVHLSSHGSPTSIKPTINGSYTIADNGAVVTGGVIIAAVSPSGIELTAGASVFSLDNDITLQAATRNVTDNISLGGNDYPGDLRIINKSGKLKLISHVDMETYVLGVVPYESGDSKSYLEAIKAQAVAARTFAYYVMNSRNRASQEHDVVNTTASQVYKGYKAKYENANSAVIATACQILLTSSGDNVFSCYSASNGGATEYPKSSGAAGTNFAYLPYKEDPYDLKFALSHSNYNAAVTIPKSLAGKDLKTSKAQPYAMLREAMKGAGADPANLPDDSVVSVKGVALTNPRYSDNSAPRAYTGADITLGVPKVGDQAARDVVLSFGPYVDSQKIKRPFLNSKLGLSDKSKFSLLYLRDDPDAYLLAAVRYGHSTGMSQVGAFQMATEGKSYKDILTFYYLMGTETKLITKEWSISNGVTGEPVPADEDVVKEEAKEPKDDKDGTNYKVTSYSAKGAVSVKGSLNVRSGPATSYSKVGTLKHKAKVTITGKSGTWYRIKYKGGAAFVKKSYIKITSVTKNASGTKVASLYPFKAKVKIKGSKLNVRSGAGKKYKRLGYLKKGAKVTVKGAKGSWYKITYKKKTAYVMKQYLKKV